MKRVENRKGIIEQMQSFEDLSFAAAAIEIPGKLWIEDRHAFKGIPAKLIRNQVLSHSPWLPKPDWAKKSMFKWHSVIIFPELLKTEAVATTIKYVKEIPPSPRAEGPKQKEPIDEYALVRN